MKPHRRQPWRSRDLGPISRGLIWSTLASTVTQMLVVPQAAVSILFGDRLTRCDHSMPVSTATYAS